MAFDLRRHDEAQLVVLRFDGEVTATEVHAVLDQLTATGARHYAVIYEE